MRPSMYKQKVYWHLACVCVWDVTRVCFCMCTCTCVCGMCVGVCVVRVCFVLREYIKRTDTEQEVKNVYTSISEVTLCV